MSEFKNSHQESGADAKYDAKYLYRRIEELEVKFARMSRKYEDLLSNLDFSNMEPKSTRKPLEATIKEVYPDGTSSESSIVHNAKEIRTEVNHVYAIKTYSGSGDPGDRDRDYIWKRVNEDEPAVYYVYSQLEEKWKETDTNEIKTAFIQTSDGFEFDGTVKIDGSLIVKGEISGDRIRGGEISGVTINVDTDLKVGNNVYIGTADDRLSTKMIRFTDTANLHSYDDGITISAAYLFYNGSPVLTQANAKSLLGLA